MTFSEFKMPRNSREKHFLEVDESILENKLNFTENENDEFASMLSEFDNRIPSKLVYPLPGLCIKIRTTDDKKLFLNLCQTDEVPEPEDISEEKLLELWSSNEDTGYRVPMSIGQLKHETDKSGSQCMVVDVAIHSKFLAKVENIASFRTFLVHVCVEGVREKLGIESEPNDFIVLKNRKMFGKLQPHRIEKRDVVNTSTKKKPLIETISSNTSNGPILQWENPNFVVLKKGNIIECRIHLPGINSKDINLQISEDRLKLQSISTSQAGGDSKIGFRLDKHFPFNVDPSTAWSCFQTRSHLLILLLQII